MGEIKLQNANTAIWRFISCIYFLLAQLVKSRALIQQYSLATLELKEKDKRSDRMTFHQLHICCIRLFMELLLLRYFVESGKLIRAPSSQINLSRFYNAFRQLQMVGFNSYLMSQNALHLNCIFHQHYF